MGGTLKLKASNFGEIPNSNIHPPSSKALRRDTEKFQSRSSKLCVRQNDVRQNDVLRLHCSGKI